jgi:hypothetical protein
MLAARLDVAAEEPTMIEITCQTCGTKAGVQSFLSAAHQVCAKCGQLLMGPLDKGSRVVRPEGFDEKLPPPAPLPPGVGTSAGLWVGVSAGIVAGVGLVIAVATLGPALPQAARGALLGALSGTLLAPVFAMFTFLAMLLPWISLDGLLGDSLWTRIARANNERRLRHLFLPILIYVVLPMVLCGLGGSRMKNINALLISAGLGAALLGAILGGICGSFPGRARQSQ